MDVIPDVPPDPKPSESVDPCVRVLRRPPHRAQTGAVWHTPAGDHGFDAALPQQSAALVVVVVVGVRLPGSAARAAGRPSYVGNGVQQGISWASWRLPPVNVTVSGVP